MLPKPSWSYFRQPTVIKRKNNISWFLNYRDYRESAIVTKVFIVEHATSNPHDLDKDENFLNCLTRKVIFVRFEKSIVMCSNTSIIWSFCSCVYPLLLLKEIRDLETESLTIISEIFCLNGLWEFVLTEQVLLKLLSSLKLTNTFSSSYPH